MLHSFFRVAESLATAQVPQEVVDGLRLGRITALQKPTGGVRGIVAGDIIRRLVGRTIAQQLGPAVERATSPFQYALSTRAGCECVAHALQALCETDPQSTVLSIDGVSAFDLISRGAMMQGLREVKEEALPFVRLFHGQPSTYLWEDDDNIVHSIPQGEGGKQGDPLMPLLFSLGQHRALQAVAAQLQDGEKLFAFLDDKYAVCPRPDRVLPVHAIIHRELWTHARIRVHNGKTHVWNMSGVRPAGCDMLQRLAEQHDREARVWTGSEVPAAEQGIIILGTPLGHDEFVRAQLELKSREHDLLISRIPSLSDFLFAWAFLLHCASSRANYLLRVIRPDLVRHFAERHDESIWTCLCQILGVHNDESDAVAKQGHPPFVNGRFGFAQCSSHQCSCSLGQLGGLFGHDQCPTP